MASLQRFSSHGQTYWRLVESYRRPDGRPSVRVLMHLGKADALLARLQGQTNGLTLRSVSSGAVDALHHLATELDVAGEIDRAVVASGGRAQVRDGLTIGQSITAAAIGRACHPSSKRALADWAKGTTLPERMHFAPVALTSQHFWDQMGAIPEKALAVAEQALVKRVLDGESLSVGLVAYDTTNFFTHIASTNGRAKLPARGHNKQRRHDLRQLGLAMVVSEEGQIPLGHVLYEGSRPDVKTFAEVMKPLRDRLQRLMSADAQLTLVFDQDAESRANLEAIRTAQAEYVTALKPSHQRKWLKEVIGQLGPCKLSTGEVIRAFRTTRAVHGEEHTVVIVWSQRLYDGQKRGLQQHLSKALARIGRISRHPRGGIEGAQQQVARICARQYVREVLRCRIEEHAGAVRITPEVDAAAIERLEKEYFGLRVLATTHSEWSTEQIIEAYRGQARVERAFRDLKDPWVCAFRPQYHWTDQKLLVHAFTAMLSLLLSRLLLHRARKLVGFTGTPRSLLRNLAEVRTCTMVHAAAERGRPRVTHQLEEVDEEIARVARAVGAIPDSTYIRPEAR